MAKVRSITVRDNRLFETLKFYVDELGLCAFRSGAKITELDLCFSKYEVRRLRDWLTRWLEEQK